MSRGYKYFRGISPEHRMSYSLDILESECYILLCLFGFKLPLKQWFLSLRGTLKSANIFSIQRRNHERQEGFKSHYFSFGLRGLMGDCFVGTFDHAY